MDLSFNRFDKDAQPTSTPSELSLLLVDIAARQAASPTAAVQARIERKAVDPRLFAPLHGAFNGPLASTMTQWKDE